MDIGDTFGVSINREVRDYKVDNIFATWRTSHNFDYAIYFLEITPSPTEGTLKTRALSSRAINANNENKLIQINANEVGHQLDPYGTFSKANLSKGDTFIYHSQAYRITRTDFFLADTYDGAYLMSLILLKI